MPQVSDPLPPAAGGAKIDKSSKKNAIDMSSETSAPSRKSTDAGAGMEREGQRGERASHFGQAPVRATPADPWSLSLSRSLALSLSISLSLTL
jgi:hypothetical protein